MSLSAWLTNLVQAVDTEYDRRIRRASNVVTYTVDNGQGADAHRDTVPPFEAPVRSHVEELDEGVEVVNVPRGTRVSPIRVAHVIRQDEVLIESK